MAAYFQCTSSLMAFTYFNSQVANYIPQLSKRDPNKFGISICTIDGQRFSIGDATLPFTLQSCW